MGGGIGVIEFQPIQIFLCVSPDRWSTLKNARTPLELASVFILIGRPPSSPPPHTHLKTIIFALPHPSSKSARQDHKISSKCKTLGK